MESRCASRQCGSWDFITLRTIGRMLRLPSVTTRTTSSSFAGSERQTGYGERRSPFARHGCEYATLSKALRNSLDVVDRGRPNTVAAGQCGVYGCFRTPSPLPLARGEWEIMIVALVTFQLTFVSS